VHTIIVMCHLNDIVWRQVRTKTEETGAALR